MEEHFCSKKKAKVSTTKVKRKKRSAKNKELAESKEAKKTKAALASLLKYNSIDEDSESEGLKSIVKAISKLKKDNRKAKLFSMEGSKDQSRGQRVEII